MNLNFARLCRHTGGYSLPWLVTLTGGSQVLRFINDRVGRAYDGNEYAAATFSYAPNAQEYGMSGGGTLEIEAADANQINSITSLVLSSDAIRLDVIGVLLESDVVSEVKSFRHSYGTVRMDGRVASFSFEPDDRLTMTFPALIFSHYNNRGND